MEEKKYQCQDCSNEFGVIRKHNFFKIQCNSCGSNNVKWIEEKYPMCESQDAQIDCRLRECKYYKGAGICSNISPAITLNPGKHFVCWSKKE